MTPREIGDALMARAVDYPSVNSVPERYRTATATGYRVHPNVERAEFAFGGLKLSCPATCENVSSMARKFQRAPACLWTPRLPRAPSLKRPKDGDALIAALEDKQETLG